MPEVGARAFRLRLHAPHPELRPWVEYYWNVDWDLGAGSFDQSVVTNPTVDLSFEDDEAVHGPGRKLVVTGVVPQAYVRHLSGRADIVAVHFHPAQFRPWWGGGMSGLTGRSQLLGTGPRAWEQAAAALLPTLLDRSFEDRAQLLDELLLDHRPPADPVADELLGLITAARDNRDLWNTNALADRRAVSARTNQRQFLDYVGVGPKWVIMRHRIHAAIERLDTGRQSGRGEDLTALAHELGYFDQAHFSREFRNLVGVPPAHYGR